MSVGPRRRTSPLGDMLGRVGRIAGQAVGGGIVPEQRRQAPGSASTMSMPTNTGILAESWEDFEDANGCIVTLPPVTTAGQWVVIRASWVAVGPTPTPPTSGAVAVQQHTSAGTTLATAAIAPSSRAACFIVVPTPLWGIWRSQSGEAWFTWGAQATGEARISIFG